jgi:hypothetical protein
LHKPELNELANVPVPETTEFSPKSIGEIFKEIAE